MKMFGTRVRVRRKWSAVLAAFALAALAVGAVACGDDDGDSEAFATVRRYEGVTDSEEAGRRVAEGFVPLISGISGFQSYFWVDAGDGVMFSTSVFDDRAGADESNLTAADWVRENLAPLLPNPPQITEGRVIARAEHARPSTMYSSVRRYEGAIDTEEIGRRVNEGFLPIITGIDGFVAYYVVDGGDGVIVSFNVYRDRAGAEASNAAAADWVRENLLPLLPNPPQITEGDVVADG